MLTVHSSTPTNSIVFQNLIPSQTQPARYLARIAYYLIIVKYPGRLEFQMPDHINIRNHERLLNGAITLQKRVLQMVIRYHLEHMTVAWQDPTTAPDSAFFCTFMC